jgi:hypothetical protein
MCLFVHQPSKDYGDKFTVEYDDSAFILYVIPPTTVIPGLTRDPAVPLMAVERTLSGVPGLPLVARDDLWCGCLRVLIPILLLPRPALAHLYPAF